MPLVGSQWNRHFSNQPQPNGVAATIRNNMIVVFKQVEKNSQFSRPMRTQVEASTGRCGSLPPGAESFKLFFLLLFFLAHYCVPAGCWPQGPAVLCFDNQQQCSSSGPAGSSTHCCTHCTQQQQQQQQQPCCCCCCSRSCCCLFEIRRTRTHSE